MPSGILGMSRRGYEMEDDEEYMKPMLPTVPEKCGPPVINLGLLIEFAVQQILHELTVLTELLPKKLDADRKISIVQFAHATRTIFIKLLAVVKWVKSSKKFESCASICYFLDQQAQYFIETADRLAQLSREELVHARLPAFQVPAAVDVLTLGAYPRLPLCIKNRFIPEGTITAREQACVLLRLNQVIQSRLSLAAAKFSPRIKNIIIKNGMVNMTVPGEFGVSLTLLGERANTKWTLLDIRMLVEDYEIGFGTRLVHPLQVNTVHNVLQLRMDNSKEPLSEVYSVLHSFAQSLQLDVLCCQASRVINGQMRQYAVIERYDHKEGVLIIAYWLKRTQHNRYTSQYRMKIFSDPEKEHSGLQVRHYPVGKCLPQIDDRTGRLSVSRLLSETVSVRCRERLLRLRERLECIKPRARVYLTGKAAPTLTYPLLGADSHDDEMLVLCVNAFSGNILALVRSLGSRQELRDLEQLLSDCAPLPAIAKLLSRLRILVMVERYRKAVAPLPVRIVAESLMKLHLSNMQSMPSDRICLQFIREDSYFLIVCFLPCEIRGVEIDIYLLSNVEGKMNLVRMHPSQTLTSAPTSNFYAKHRDDSPPLAKRSRWLGNTKQLTSSVATIDDRLSFMRICEELDRRGVKYRPLVTEPTVGGLMLQITDFSSAVSAASSSFLASVVRCVLRLDTRTRVIWPFEHTVVDVPLVADFYQPRYAHKPLRTKTSVLEIHSSGGVSVTSTNTADSVSQNMIDRMIAFSHMHDVVKNFAIAYYAHYHKLCCITAFTYHKLVIAYGAQRDQLMFVSWRMMKNANPKQYFYLTFGIGPNRAIANAKTLSIEPERPTQWNPHMLLKDRLQENLNRRRSLTELMQYLIETVAPLSSLHAFTKIKLQSLRAYSQMLCAESSLPVSLQASLLVVDELTIRLVYGPIELEFLLLSGSRVAVRDCARSTPTAYRLHTFCSRFVTHELRIAHEERSPGSLSWMRSPSGPSSLPPHQMGRSPASRIVASPMSHMSLSVPPSESEASPLRCIPSEHSSHSRAPMLIDHNALQRMTSINECGVCPLEEYLFALSYLSRLGPALEGYRREHRGSGAHPVVQFRHLSVTPESVRVSVMGAAPPNMKHDPFIVTFHIHLDEETMTLKLKLDFEGEEVPPMMDIRIAERYFERCVARLGNELALVSFINACRLAVPGAFSAMAKIMNAQMEWTEDSPWRPSLQLTVWSHEGSNPRARLSLGIVIDQTNVSVLILLCLRATRHDPNERNADASKHLIQLIYNTQTNSVMRRGGAGEEDASGVNQLLATISEKYARLNERSLWPAVHALAHNFMHSRSVPA
uniref:Mediator of RNA polymerase II transcription subunit 14 n=1 Tax=Parascaris univalens TaxID=6257 RepID=A0A915AIY3_PARUN